MTIPAARVAPARRVRAWSVFAVVYFASAAAAMAYFSVPPLMPELMREFGVDLVQAGLLMAVFSIVGVVLALPAGVLLARVGALAVGLVAIASVVVGSVLGALTLDFSVLLVSRTIQGLGMGLMGVVAPAVVAAVFPAERRGLPMGLWAASAPLAGVLMYNLAPRLTEVAGWQAVWWFIAGVAVVALVLYPPMLHDILPKARGGTSRAGPGIRAALLVPSVLLLGAFFFLNSVGYGTPVPFLPTFLATVHGYDLVVASSVTGLFLLAQIIAGPIAGVVSDRIGSRKLVYTLPPLFVAVLWLVVFAGDGSLLVPLLLIGGLLAGAAPPVVLAAASEVVPDPRLAPMALAVVILGMNLALLVGPVLFGGVVDAAGWMAAVMTMAAVTCAGAVVGWQVKVR